METTETLRCVATLDDDMPCGVAQDQHDGLHHEFRSPSPAVVEAARLMPYAPNKDAHFSSVREVVEAIGAPKPAPGCEDTITLTAEISLSFTERVLLLFRPLRVKARIDCQYAPGNTFAVTHAYAARWSWPRQSRPAMAVQPTGETI